MTTSSFESGVYDPLTGERLMGDSVGPLKDARPSNAEKGSHKSEPRRAPHGNDRVLQAYFDKDPRLNAAALREAIRQTPALAEDIARTQRVLNELNRPARTPDLSKAILDAVDHKRSFVTSRTRLRISAARLAIAASVLAGVAIVVMLKDAASSGVKSPMQQGIESVLSSRAAPSIAPTVVSTDAMAVRTVLADSKPARAEEAPARHAPVLSFGDVREYDRPLKFDIGGPRPTRVPREFDSAIFAARTSTSLLSARISSLTERGNSGLGMMFRQSWPTNAQWSSPAVGRSPLADTASEGSYLMQLLGSDAMGDESSAGRDDRMLPRR
jgi:hypothetical protein